MTEFLYKPTRAFCHLPWSVNGDQGSSARGTPLQRAGRPGMWRCWMWVEVLGWSHLVCGCTDRQTLRNSFGDGSRSRHACGRHANRALALVLGHARVPEWPFLVARRRLTWAALRPSNQHVDRPHLWRGMDYRGKGEALTNADLWTVFDRNGSIVYVGNVLDLWVQEKNPSVAFIFLVSMLVYRWRLSAVFHRRDPCKCAWWPLCSAWGQARGDRE